MPNCKFAKVICSPYPDVPSNTIWPVEGEDVEGIYLNVTTTFTSAGSASKYETRQMFFTHAEAHIIKATEESQSETVEVPNPS